MTPATDPFPTCRRKALWSLGFGLASLAAALGLWASQAPVGDWVLGLVTGLGVGGLFAAALLWFTPDMTDAVPKRLARRYQRDVALAMGTYVIVMLFWKRLLDSVDAVWLKWIIALFPALLVCWVMRAFVTYVRDSDEMQRRIELESGAIAALLVSAVYLALGFLQSAKLIDVHAGSALIMVFPATCLMYGLVKIFVARRYL
jgi:hypothetical protein